MIKFTAHVMIFIRKLRSHFHSKNFQTKILLQTQEEILRDWIAGQQVTNV